MTVLCPPAVALDPSVTLRASLEGDVFQGPKVGVVVGGVVVLFVAAKQPGEGVAQACTEHRRSGVGPLVELADMVELGEVFDADGDVGHGDYSGLSGNFVNGRLFGAPRTSDRPEKLLDLFASGFRQDDLAALPTDIGRDMFNNVEAPLKFLKVVDRLPF